MTHPASNQHASRRAAEQSSRSHARPHGLAAVGDAPRLFCLKCWPVDQDR
ncbi:hypothetical protein HBI56_034920 [Parastagonospora nodorum]|uniref:Uncharacterized protein n=1 Tax=Phaeosphaeria nodorum (strain SN15 / ATCC MYA-4574 / FGSC 10173) TaxID=321614 RepID=A0A7U2HZ10_PHANO|nr:hypothetical protein HBH56_022730 [Parastagonospora nodorum]QRC95609.1 hypothetical protein JI435_407600 [Parastagonospora nodorum SN15]KAH3936856.1 hypothetical protein HBH54_011730 [Parastagonospora nodorum]KAH3944139.1 hypothetical protein HBH53_164980 [Parastagonospora nodorum]KAH3967533.1 hypothetical protein HBH51_135180 [Parastagonospora nodorum]